MDVKKTNTQMNMDITVEVPAQDNQKMAMVMYMVDGWEYIKTDIPGLGDSWQKRRFKIL